LSQASEGGQLCLSFEIVYAHAFKPPPRLSVSAQTVVSLDEMRQALAAGKNRPPAP
jgi:malonyl-CoA O-methyltransferase